MTYTKKFIKKILDKLAITLQRLSEYIYISPQEIRATKWFKDNGDKTLRISYDLDNYSIVFDVGGYEGNWSSDIFSKYCCTIYIFEPVKHYYENIKKRFKSNKKINVYNFGLAKENKDTFININNDSSSVFLKGNQLEKITLVKFSDFIIKNHIKKIDLIKINIEGGEYDLLEHIILSELIKIVENIQVQFHDFMPDAENRMKEIQRKLKKTHKLTYQYFFIWENWKLRKNL